MIRHTYFKSCPTCGAHLDPGEHCNCRSEEYRAGYAAALDAVEAFVTAILKDQDAGIEFDLDDFAKRHGPAVVKVLYR